MLVYRSVVVVPLEYVRNWEYEKGSPAAAVPRCSLK